MQERSKRRRRKKKQRMLGMQRQKNNKRRRKKMEEYKIRCEEARKYIPIIPNNLYTCNYRRGCEKQIKIGETSFCKKESELEIKIKER